ncbi:TolC family protein [Candidatus Cytomitobacter indipagum]|uniref:TolC family protein n=1 Tax=Candidatus Cytomitobacter indipagum TaxID=2601575 RepID=A0A5C0UDH7_9PROT|nr:TolC family protein [Candidatus Cytomitobacter indipagum]QEK37797.1 TolC family protein [Candidatus Cytomitobacter indipagum]
MNIIFKSILSLVLCFCSFESMQAKGAKNTNTTANVKKHSNQSRKRDAYHKSELSFISSGDIKQIEDWASKVVASNNYVKCIRAKFVSKNAKNIADIMAFFPSVDVSLSHQHVFRENGANAKKVFDAKWHNKEVKVNLIQLKNSMITDIAASGMKSKADLEEYWKEWSKFCLEDVISNLIDWIAQKSIVRMKQNIVNSRKSIVRKIDLRIQTGVMNVSDLYSAQSELATSEAELFIAQNKAKVLRNKLDDISGGIEPPQQIGVISEYGNWEENKSSILRNSHDLKQEYYMRKHKIAKGSSNVLGGTLPNLGIEMSFNKKSDHHTFGSNPLKKWRGSFDLSLSQHIGLDNIPRIVSGSKGVVAARLEYLEAVRKTITAGHEVFADLENSAQELKMHRRALEIHEKSLRVKRELFFNDLELQGKRRLSIDDVIYAEGNVTYGHNKTIEAYQKAAKSYFTLMHMKGELARRIGNRKNSNKSFENSVKQAQIKRNKKK